MRNDVVSSIGNWTTSIPELTWAERPSDYDIEFKLGDCPDNSDFFGCVADRSFSNDSRADANYQDTAVVWIQDRSDWGVGGRQSVIAHELGHLYGMHEAYIENANNPCNSARTSIMDGVTTDANNKIVHCDGLTGPNTTDVSVVEAMYRTGQMGSMTASSSGTSATFTWKDGAWAERWYELQFFWWNHQNQTWVFFARPSHSDDVGVHVPNYSCSSSAACEDRTLSRTVNRVAYGTPSAWYAMCGWPEFRKYRSYGTWRCSPYVYVQ